MLNSSDLSSSSQMIKQIIDLVDTSIYWKDKEGRYLGCNQYVLKIAGLNSLDEILGKTDFELVWKREASKIKEIDDWVMRTGNSYRGEEAISTHDGKLLLGFSIKNPLLDKNGQIIGVIGTSVDITAKKEAERLALENIAYKTIQEQERRFRQIINVVDVSIYWKDREGRYLGCNQYVLNIAGLNSLNEILGKTDFELVWKKEAPKVKEIDDWVVRTGSPYRGEEFISVEHTNQVAAFFTIKNPLFDDDGQVIGIVGTSIDITAKKEAEVLKLEAEKHKIIEEQQREFRKIVEQVAHDIRSPVGAQRMNLNECKHYLPELYRVAFTKSLNRIDDVAYRLMSTVNPGEKARAYRANPVKEPTLISNEIFEVIAEKRHEYREKTIDFCAHFTESAYFAFLNINTLDFKRMLSNLINNAVDAIQDKIGRVDVHMDASELQVQITIQDNGMGMPDSVKEKILNNIAVTASKTDGHGIGFGQIRDTLKEAEGELAIESIKGVGTKIILSFPRVDSPNWIATQIELFSDDMIVVLDDDDSIHDAWEARFQKVAPNIPRHHFKGGKEAILFINNFDDAAKKKLLLLTDYELLEQELHGLEVVEKTGIKRSILVTSHNDNPKVTTLAESLHTKILPKPLAAHVPIEFKVELETEALRKVDAVYVDDDEDLLAAVTRAMQTRNKVIDTYSSVYKFLENKAVYPKDVKIILDNQFQREYARGIEIAQELHEAGYTRLYLFSGEYFDSSQDGVIPPYLTVIFKTDIDRLFEVLDE